MVIRVITSLAFTIVCVFVCYVLVLIGSDNTRTYVGTKEFQTLDEAYIFQSEVLSDADLVNASVIECTITTVSPVTVEFKVELEKSSFFPKRYHFEHGKTELSYTACWIGLSIAGVLFLAVYIGGMYSLGWRL